MTQPTAAEAPDTIDQREGTTGLQYVSDGVVVQLNDRWRVFYDELQWMLQRRSGSEWNNRSYCVIREGLLRCIREYLRDEVVDATALDIIRALPEWHPDRQTYTSPLGEMTKAEPRVAARFRGSEPLDDERFRDGRTKAELRAGPKFLRCAPLQGDDDPLTYAASGYPELCLDRAARDREGASS